MNWKHALNSIYGKPTPWDMSNPILDYIKYDTDITTQMYAYLSEKRGERNTPMATPQKPKVKRAIFNNPATIIYWTDGTKTVVKCQEGDTYDKEKGFVMAYLKKLLGNDNTFNKEINKWVYGG